MQVDNTHRNPLRQQCMGHLSLPLAASLCQAKLSLAQEGWRRISLALEPTYRLILGCFPSPHRSCLIDRQCRTCLPSDHRLRSYLKLHRSLNPTPWARVMLGPPCSTAHPFLSLFRACCPLPAL